MPIFWHCCGRVPEDSLQILGAVEDSFAIHASYVPDTEELVPDLYDGKIGFGSSRLARCGRRHVSEIAPWNWLLILNIDFFADEI
jgi:hypothetical protein